MFAEETGFLPSLGWAVLNSLWQMAILWVVYQVITGIWKAAKPGIKTILASSFLVIGFCWFLLSFFAVFQTNSLDDSFISSPITGATTNTEITNSIKDLLPYASVLYLVLLAFQVFRFIRNFRYVRIIRRYGLSKIHVDWRIFIKNIAARMGIRKKVSIWISEFVSSPVTIGFIKPVILVPLAAINHLSTAQLEAILLHELSHIKRYDFLINLVVNFVKTVLYFNPFVKAFVSIVEREREKSCDDMVLQFQYDSHEYASALLTLEKANFKQGIFTMASVGRKNDLLNRVESIMGIEKKSSFSLYKTAGILAGFCCIITMNALFTGKESKAAGEYSYAYLSSPFSAMTSGHFQTKGDADNVINHTDATFSGETMQQSIENKIAENTATEKATVADVPDDAASATAIANNNPFQLAGYAMPVIIPRLPEIQEQQVKSAIDASRKVLENAQWKALEKNIADVFTEKEKEELKASYRDEINKFDWNKWENKLRLAFEKVDWDNVNYQLTNAVNQIRIDSLQKVYNNVVVKLNDVQRELSLKGLTGIPDSDITLSELEKRKQEALRTLMNLKVIRDKKVVHL